MIRKSLLALAGACALTMSASAVTYSQLSVDGQLADGWSLIFSPIDLTLFYPEAFAGDLSPTRQGDIDVKFVASDPSGITMVSLTWMGALEGLGSFHMRGAIEDFTDSNNPIQIGAFDFSVLDHSELPSTRHVAIAPTTVIRITHAITLSAPDQTDPSGLDIAALTLTDHTFQVVPEPASIIGLALGAAALIRRRR